MQVTSVMMRLMDFIRNFCDGATWKQSTGNSVVADVLFQTGLFED